MHYSVKDAQPDDVRTQAVRRALAAGVDAYWWHGAVAAEVARSGPTNHVALAGNLGGVQGSWSTADVARYCDELVAAGVLRTVPPQWDYAPAGVTVRWIEYVTADTSRPECMYGYGAGEDCCARSCPVHGTASADPYGPRQGARSPVEDAR